MIKYFACGFLIATTTAFVFECVTLHLVSKLILIFLPIQVESDEGYGMSGFSFFDLSPYHMYEYTAAASAFSQQHPNISVIFLFFSAYCVAALVEEACKYFGYCIVEHPDFVSERDLTKAASYGVPVQSEGEPEDDRFEWGGGLECISGNEESGEYESFDDDDEESRDGQPRFRSARSNEQREPVRFKAVELAECPPRTRQSVASAITIAMVSVALGFACCESLLNCTSLYIAGSHCRWKYQSSFQEV